MIIIASNTIEEARGTMVAKGLRPNECILLSAEQAYATRGWASKLMGLRVPQNAVIGSMAHLVKRDYPEIFVEE
jgi:hypothetical protein